MLEGHTDPRARLPRSTTRAADGNFNPNQPLKIFQEVRRTVQGTRIFFAGEGPLGKKSGGLHYAQGSLQEQAVDRARDFTSNFDKTTLKFEMEIDLLSTKNVVCAHRLRETTFVHEAPQTRAQMRWLCVAVVAERLQLAVVAGKEEDRQPLDEVPCSEERFEDFAKQHEDLLHDDEVEIQEGDCTLHWRHTRSVAQGRMHGVAVGEGAVVAVALRHECCEGRDGHAAVHVLPRSAGSVFEHKIFARTSGATHAECPTLAQGRGLVRVAYGQLRVDAVPRLPLPIRRLTASARVHGDDAVSPHSAIQPHVDGEAEASHVSTEVQQQVAAVALQGYIYIYLYLFIYLSIYLFVYL